MQQILDLFSAPTAAWFCRAFGKPTKVQEESWPAIMEGKHVLVSAPTGTGKTLSAFLVFIDRFKTAAREGKLKEQLYLVYVSPLKSLAADIRENLRRPLDGIACMEQECYSERGTEIVVGVRTGDTPQKDRQRMIKHPPHILIITPESLYLMLTSKTGREILKTARTLIIDELHALIDTKRGAHLMLSAARLDQLCGRSLQRIGLSATIEPLPLAAQYLAPEPAVIVAPPMEKKIKIKVVGTLPPAGRRKDPVWEELGREVYGQCLKYRSVIAFCEGRRYAEKIAFYVNELGGEGFARVHHGSLSKEQRMEVEGALREGKLRLLCATSSMELGIDVGEIDLVLQIGCPRSISSTMQRLGRAGHNPGRTSRMYMYPRTAPEGLYCGMTAQAARQGGVEHACPPRLCLDVLAQHLVSMAAAASYTVDDVMEVLPRAYSFTEVTREDVKSVLCMLAGDYEHSREIPVRPRVLYDRIHERVEGDAYSRMLAVAAGGTIPDKGLYTAKTQEGVKLGELDEEFVYETRIGDKIMLGSFGWRVVRQDRDNVIVAPADISGARLPFWKGEIKGRSLRTSQLFGQMIRGLAGACENGTILEELGRLGLDQAACEAAADFMKRQLAATGVMPDDRTIVAEHFRDSQGMPQLMVHSMFGRRVNGPLSLLVQHAARRITGSNAGCVDEEDGFLLYPYEDCPLPEGLLYAVDPGQARDILEAVLPVTPLFSMNFRYNAGRALMMGIRKNSRQPLWLQRLKSTQMLDSLTHEKNHPLIRETRRECLEEQWDIEGLMEILHGIRSGLIAVREVYVDSPSPMSLPLQWQVEAAEMYEYYPSTQGIRENVYEELKAVEMMKPSRAELEKAPQRDRTARDARQLHSLMMMEGDFVAQELAQLAQMARLEEMEQETAQIMQKSGEVPQESEGTAQKPEGTSQEPGMDALGRMEGWLEELLGDGQAVYIEPGLWIAGEHRQEYEAALAGRDTDAAQHIVRRMLYYRGGQSKEQILNRYVFPEKILDEVLGGLLEREEIVEDDSFFYHAKQYSRARRATIAGLRTQAATTKAESYAALMASRTQINAPDVKQLKITMEQYCGQTFPASVWENIIFPRRVKGYRESMLDQLLAQGEFFFKMTPEGYLGFYKTDEIDWDREVSQGNAELDEEEQLLYGELKKRGASFLKALAHLPSQHSAQEILLCLAQKGIVCADSFVPVRQWLNQDKMKKAAVRQRVNVRVMALSAGRWDVVHPLRPVVMEEWLEKLFGENMILCRETYRKPPEEDEAGKPAETKVSGSGWGDALEVLRIWEYIGRVRRGYFVAGMSGAQFIRSQDYDAVTHMLGSFEDNGGPDQALGTGKEVIWLNAADPAQVWGKALAHREGRAFVNVPGTAVALKEGEPVAVLERQGKVLRILGDMEGVMEAFVRDFKNKRIFPGIKRLIVKEYPAQAGMLLKNAGFMKEIQDYVLYR